MTANSKRPLKSWNEVSSALEAIGAAMAEKAELENSLQPEIDRLTNDLRVQTAPISDRINDLTEKIVSFTEDHLDEFSKSKSKELPNGKVSVRQTCRVEFEDEQKSAEQLIELGFGHCVKHSFKPIKAAVKNFDPKTMEIIGACLVNDVKISVEPLTVM